MMKRCIEYKILMNDCFVVQQYNYQYNYHYRAMIITTYRAEFLMNTSLSVFFHDDVDQMVMMLRDFLPSLLTPD